MEKAKILVVEDEIIIAMEIADRLKSMNYRVLRIVANGKDAIETANRALAINPNNRDALAIKGQAYQKQRNFVRISKYGFKKRS